MGRRAQARRAVDGLARVLAIEIVTGCRALDLRAPLQPGPPPPRSAPRCAPRASPDRVRPVSPDLEAATELVLTGAIADAVHNSGHRPDRRRSR
jgi:histidine ammonia-lyase